MNIKQAVANKLSQWNVEAELNFFRRLREGVKMSRCQFANGKVMVGHDGCLPNQYVTLERATQIWNEWKSTGKVSFAV